MNGHTVRQWNDAGGFSSYIDPALAKGEPGHVFVTLETAKGSGIDLVPGRAASQISKTIAELDWNGNVVWRFGDKAPGGLAQQHHDWARLANGNTIVLANLVHSVAGFKQTRVLDDVVYEVNPSGEIVWKWLASDHFDEFGFTPEQLKLVRNADTADYLHVNNLKVVGPNHWFDSGDKRFDPENLIFCSRNANFIAIIDKKSGKIVWTLGPNYPAIPRGGNARALPRPVDQISGQHDAQTIPVDCRAPAICWCSIIKGRAGIRLWNCKSREDRGYWKSIRSKKKSCGNIPEKIRAALAGRSVAPTSAPPAACPTETPSLTKGRAVALFQVTADGDIVWEYVNQYPRRGKDSVTGRKNVNHQLYRAQPVPFVWAPVDTPHSDTPVRVAGQ